MKIFKESSLINYYLKEQKIQGKKIGFVPTMGALHQGHISLIKKAIDENDITVCSIFINPTQFNDQEDFLKYPKTISEDVILLESCNADVLFLPEYEEIYPGDEVNKNIFDFGAIENVLEGAHRVNHFKGVGQVVSLLLKIVEPTILYLGQKDYQQYLVLKKLVENILFLDIEVKRCEIVREENGLAMSSRNERLNAEERREAKIIYEVLKAVKEQKNEKSLQELKQWAASKLIASPVVQAVDYFEIADATDLQPVQYWHEAAELIACTAVKVGDVRLIDNMIL